MLRRTLNAAFVAGAYVFPGGAVDADDRSADTLSLVAAPTPAEADARLGTDQALGFWVAAIRESFEEAGVLLACDASSGEPISGDRDSFAADRLRLASGDASFPSIVRERGAVLDAGALAPFAHWITPEGNPRRYDTWFFVAAAPEGHVYEHDDTETVASEWIEPSVALERARTREIELIYPTFRSLQMLAHFDSSAAVLEAVRAVWAERSDPMLTVNPEQGWVVDLPGVDHGRDGVADAIQHSTTSAGRPPTRSGTAG